MDNLITLFIQEVSIISFSYMLNLMTLPAGTENLQVVVAHESEWLK